MCHRLQMGATRASDARQVDYMFEVLGVIADHTTPKVMTDEVCFTIHVYGGGMVVVISKDNRTTDGKQSSWQLLRSRRLHRHVYNRG